MASNPFHIDTHDLPRRAGEMREFTLEIDDHEPLGFDIISIAKDEPIYVDLKLEAVAEGVLATATIETTAVGECIRCLDPVELPIDQSFQELFEYEIDYRQKKSSKKPIPESDEEGEEVRQMVGDIIDLEPSIRDAVILDLPIHPLCDPDCPGLCPECGIKWSLLPEDHAHATPDIRWAGLDGWKSKDA